MCGGLFFTGVLSMILTNGEALPLIAGALSTCVLYFILAPRVPLTFLRIYFCVLPVLVVFIFALLAVGIEGNDRFYFINTAMLPLVLFKRRIFYAPLMGLSIISFFVIPHVQILFEPMVEIPADVWGTYENTNYVLVFIFSIALLSLFKIEITGYQNNIQEQKQIVEEKNREITESITYASRIQEAILPVQEKFDRLLPQNYVWYQPKDIVAGDFYWLESSGDDVFLAAADCTGHGVPGAMVSVVCHNSLNRAVREFGLRSPAAILDKTRELVIETFSESNHNVKDGMDIALCRINLKSMSLTYSGANNSLYYIRNNNLAEIKPDKQPIGKFERQKPFQEHTLSLQKGDIIHIFTDGFADQFGGPKGKKFKYKTFKDLLVSVAGKDIREQKNLIEKKFLDWRGDFEQVDDVCVIGIRIN
jgi:serine phosphatase RsbU (regulator of sigma subunit)